MQKMAQSKEPLQVRFKGQKGERPVKKQFIQHNFQPHNHFHKPTNNSYRVWTIIKFFEIFSRGKSFEI